MNYSGDDTKLQIGKETTWGSTLVAPTIELDMISEEFGEEMILNTEETLVGKATAGRSDIMGKKVAGGFTILVKPDNIGLLLACALGCEANAAAAEATSTVYDHDFSLITGSATTLPFFTTVVDKKTGVKGYRSNKVASISFDLAKNDYLKATVSTIGYSEGSDALEDLQLSTLRAWNFNDLLVEIDDTPINEIESLTITLNNNLEDDLFVADGSAYMIEIDRQRREVTIDMDVLWNADMETLRTSKYKEAASSQFEAIFTGETAGASLKYSLTFKAEKCYYTADPIAKIGGPERLRGRISLRAASIGTTEPLVVTLRDLLGTKHSA